MNLKVFDEKSDRNIQIRINPEFERLVPQLTSKDTIPIKDIIIKERYRKEFGDIDTLADNISSVGLLQPVVINENNELIDGQRRILAYQKLGRNEIPCFKIDLEEMFLVSSLQILIEKILFHQKLLELKKLSNLIKNKKRKKDN